MSTLATSLPPLAVGKADSATELANSLGRVYEVAGKRYRLCKASAAIAAAANKVVITAVSGTAPTWNVNVTTTAASPLVAGVIPPGQTGSDGTTGLVSGDYFLAQVSGAATPIVVTGALAAGTGLTTVATAGSADAVTATYAAVVHGSIFAVLIAASVAATASAARLTGLD